MRTESKPWDLIRIMPAWESEPPLSVHIPPVAYAPGSLQKNMPLYVFVWQLLAWSITVAVLFPLTIPWAALAYKIWHGNKPIDEDFSEEIWSRALRVSWYFALAAVLFAGLDFAILDWVDLPAGVLHIVFYLGFLALAAAIMWYCFSLEDFFQGLMIAVIYLYIPAAAFFVIWLVIRGFVKFGLFSYVLSWLKDPQIV